jgi:hypothetical protein
MGKHRSRAQWVRDVIAGALHSLSSMNRSLADCHGDV